MKVLHIIFSFPPDGAETMLVDIINGQSETEQVELIIINNVYNQDLIERINKKINVYCLKRMPGSKTPIKFILLNLKIYKFKPDIIHFHSHNAIGLARYKGAAKTLLTIHGLQRPMSYLRKYDKLIAISESVRKDLMDRGGLSSILIYNGINFCKIPIRKEAFNDKIYRIIQVGRLFHKIKGQDILLKALHNLVYIQKLNNVHIDFIGEGPSLHYLQNLTFELGLQTHVNFLGLKDRDYIYDALNRYSLLVQPSIHEGFGLAIAEGMAAKIPVLVSNIPGPLEVIGNGKHGYYFQTQDPTSCAREITNIFNAKQESQFLEKLGLSRDFAIKNYSIQATTRSYLREYNRS